jgi:hypothetical protein
MRDQSHFKKQTLTLDSVTWTPVTTLFNCNNIVIKNYDQVNAIKIRTTATDPNTEDQISAGSQEVVATIPRNPIDKYSWFIEFTTYAYLQSVATTGVAKVTYIR